MRSIRTLARPLLAGVFIAGGLDVLRNPEPRANVAKPVVDAVASVVPFAPTDPVSAVKLNAAVHVGAGTLLAAGVFSPWPRWRSRCRSSRRRLLATGSGRSTTP